jgi:hypothetical protein
MGIVVAGLFEGPSSRRVLNVFGYKSGDSIIEDLERMDLSTIISPENFRRAASQDFNLFNISRWDRESDSDNAFDFWV